MSTSAVAKKLVVCGGNGFLGSRICKYAVARGWDVTSISRSGEPKWSAVTSSPSPPQWSHKVSWERADMLSPVTYAPLLKGADFVVHSMGILLEADYKGVVSGQESPVSGLQKAFAPVKDRGVDPLKTSAEPGGGPGADLKPPNPKDQFSYEVMNRDSAIALAKQANAEDAKAFVYVSAAGGAPVLPARYITTKREAESTIASEFPRMRGIFPRPPFMYDSSRKFTLPLAAMTGAGALFNRLTGGVLSGFMGASGVKPLPVETVAEAVVEALDDVKVQGPIEVPELEELATKGWRKTML
ncbi:NAD dependent epimerase/dehydratase [Colletotrichum acutatum]|uniref:NAD dependent epimerase/dehydratase n=5 Tax=Colletotrichum acutatum species complex TaxID=2707335 RepID=A0A135SXN4_9PEZI|nr:NAD dependent epimerase/dehydratase [Colletotrichum acutatum]XP_060383492.1 NAD dependent epimerase/dehydratase [Colletotrichum tamarilloi]KAI3537919.1 NAD dependent epimerase/dehydratase [Colletotrichum filicis]KAK0382601.1 NAD dependent epimerase/dehydratase [Colletotrichum limetticola]KAK1462360.1 NAD dependent epimerase/dehydratase [Colletotrichum melonis]KXH40672.1 NAD dependent epimerase/dehydratase [Colletotrichum simmondsii]KAK1501569.1 NAD dependent epimerase/dehydratase [Colletot